MNNKLGRTRITRFAAVTVPATALSLGLGLAVVQGMVGAAFASGDQFKLTSDNITASGLAVRPGYAGAVGAEKSSAVAEVTAGNASNLGLSLTKDLPGAAPAISMKFCLNGTNFNLGNVHLNAGQLTTTGTTNIGGVVTVGTQQQTPTTGADFKDADTGYDATGFALSSVGTAGSQVLPMVDANAYKAVLPTGLSGLTSLSIKTALGATAPIC